MRGSHAGQPPPKPVGARWDRGEHGGGRRGRVFAPVDVRSVGASSHDGPSGGAGFRPPPRPSRPRRGRVNHSAPTAGREAGPRRRQARTARACPPPRQTRARSRGGRETGQPSRDVTTEMLSLWRSGAVPLPHAVAREHGGEGSDWALRGRPSSLPGETGPIAVGHDRLGRAGLPRLARWPGGPDRHRA